MNVFKVSDLFDSVKDMKKDGVKALVLKDDMVSIRVAYYVDSAIVSCKNTFSAVAVLDLARLYNMLYTLVFVINEVYNEKDNECFARFIKKDNDIYLSVVIPCLDKANEYCLESIYCK